MSSVILASASSVRRDLLVNAGVALSVIPAQIDEDMIKDSLHAEGASSLDAATVLAEMKAVKVSRAQPGQLVIGADQILELDGRWFHKPKTMEEARSNLLDLKGQTHHLATAAVVAKDGQRIWHYADLPRLTMRDFTESFLDDYLQSAGNEILSSVGAYQIESIGVQLFNKVDGGYFSVLGLPLLPVLDFLRTHQVLTS